MSMRCVWLLSLTLIAGLAADVRLRAQEPAETFEEAEVATAPVVLDGAVLLRVRGVSSFPAPTRARVIGEQIAKVASDRTIPARFTPHRRGRRFDPTRGRQRADHDRR